MKFAFLTTLLAFAFGSTAHAGEIQQPAPVTFIPINVERNYEFELPYDAATTDGLIKLMEATTEEYYAMFNDGTECHSGSRLGGVIKQNDGVIRGTITVILDGFCQYSNETEEQAIERARAYTADNLAGVNGLVVNW